MGAKEKLDKRYIGALALLENQTSSVSASIPAGTTDEETTGGRELDVV